MDEQIVFGDRMIPVRLPDRTKIVPPGLSISLPRAEAIHGKEASIVFVRNPLIGSRQ